MAFPLADEASVVRLRDTRFMAQASHNRPYNMNLDFQKENTVKNLAVVFRAASCLASASLRGGPLAAMIDNPNIPD
jgi:hypothetical protein